MRSELIYFSLSLIGLMAASAFFSASETALTAVSRARLHTLAREGEPRAAVALKLLERQDRLIGCALLGNNAVNILGTALATQSAVAYFGDEGVALATAFMTVIILIFAEVMPKTFAVNRAEQTALAVARPMRFVVAALAPFSAAVRFIIMMLFRMIGVEYTSGGALSASDLRGIIALAHHEGGVVKDDKDMLAGVLDLAGRDLASVMVHRRNIVSLNADLPPEEICDAALNGAHTRLPLWREAPENIIGVLHVKNLVRALRRKEGGRLTSEDILACADEPWFVPETVTLSRQLHEFRRRGRHLALVVDEYGCLVGLVTLEDILEEIVGQIRDETDLPGGDEVTLAKDGAVVAPGDAGVHDVNRAADWDLPEEYARTVAGLVMHYMETIPVAGDEHEEDGYLFQVLEKKDNMLTLIKIIRTAGGGRREKDDKVE